MMRTTTISAFFYVSVCCHILSSSSQRAALALSVFVAVVVASVVGCVHYSTCSQPGCRSPMVREHALFASRSFACSITFRSHCLSILFAICKRSRKFLISIKHYKALTTYMQVKLRPQKIFSDNFQLIKIGKLLLRFVNRLKMCECCCWCTTLHNSWKPPMENSLPRQKLTLQRKKKEKTTKFQVSFSEGERKFKKTKHLRLRLNNHLLFIAYYYYYLYCPSIVVVVGSSLPFFFLLFHLIFVVQWNVFVMHHV